MDEQQDLRSPDLSRRLAAAESLAQMGSDAAVAAVDLLNACGDEAEEVREWVVSALEELGPPPTTTIDAIEALVSSNNPLTAYWALTLLGRAGSDAQGCQDSVAGALTSSIDDSVRERAAWCLGKIGVSSKAATEALVQATESSNARLARLAKASLAPAAH